MTKNIILGFLARLVFLELLLWQRKPPGKTMYIENIQQPNNFLKAWEEDHSTPNHLGSPYASHDQVRKQQLDTLFYGIGGTAADLLRVGALAWLLFA